MVDEAVVVVEDAVVVVELAVRQVAAGWQAVCLSTVVPPPWRRAAPARFGEPPNPSTAASSVTPVTTTRATDHLEPELIVWCLSSEDHQRSCPDGRVPRQRVDRGLWPCLLLTFAGVLIGRETAPLKATGTAALEDCEVVVPHHRFLSASVTRGHGPPRSAGLTGARGSCRARIGGPAMAGSPPGTRCPPARRLDSPPLSLPGSGRALHSRPGLGRAQPVRLTPGASDRLWRDVSARADTVTSALPERRKDGDGHRCRCRRVPGRVRGDGGQLVACLCHAHGVPAERVRAAGVGGELCGPVEVEDHIGDTRWRAGPTSPDRPR